MFTGLIETTGILRRRAGRPVARAFIETSLGPLTLGESISVNGACLTVDRIVEKKGFEADLSSETLAKTTLGGIRVGSRVHLERATPLGGRMGGHMVLGHVDCVGRVHALETIGDATRFTVRAPAEIARFVAPKGSIALDGVSLTLNNVSGASDALNGEVVFDVMLVPHTIDRTFLRELAPGASINIEVDVLARYVARQLELGTLPMNVGVGLQGESSGQHAGRIEKEVPNAHEDERILSKLRTGGYL
jgi:riboflavin synthase